MLDRNFVSQSFDRAESAWQRSFSLLDVKCLVVCRGPVRREAFLFTNLPKTEYLQPHLRIISSVQKFATLGQRGIEEQSTCPEACKLIYNGE